MATSQLGFRGGNILINKMSSMYLVGGNLSVEQLGKLFFLSSGEEL